MAQGPGQQHQSASIPLDIENVGLVPMGTPNVQQPGPAAVPQAAGGGQQVQQPAQQATLGIQQLTVGEQLQAIKEGGLVIQNGEVVAPVVQQEWQDLQFNINNNGKLKALLTQSLRVGEGIDEKVVKQIWDKKYVDFAPLLHPEDTKA